MKNAVGLWIDHRKAVIVVITDKGEETKLIISTLKNSSAVLVIHLSRVHTKHSKFR